MEYDPYVVLPEEVASSVIFCREQDEDFGSHLLHVRSCGLVSKLWCFCIAKYALILARNEFSAADYVAASDYFRLSSNLNLDPGSPASFYYEFSSFVYRQINQQRGCEVGFIEESLQKDSDEKSGALLDLVLRCIKYTCPEERSTYFEPPTSPKKSALVQRSLDTNKLFATPLIPLPVEPRSLTLRTIEQILSLLEVHDFDIHKLLEIIREFTAQGPAERKYLASRYIIPRLVNLHLGYNNNPMKHPDTKEDDYTPQITTHHQLAAVFLIGAKLDKSYARSVKRSEESDMMDLEPGAGDSNLPPIVNYNESTNDAIKGSEEVIPTTQLDMEMLFHKNFIRDVILDNADRAEKMLPLIKDFIHHWSYQNENKLQFFNDMFTDICISENRRSSLLLDLLESYTRIQDDLTELRVEFVTKLLVHHIIKVLGLQEAFFYAQLLQKLTITHPCASAVLLELRHEWLIKFYLSKDEQMRNVAEEIMTDLLWLQADKQSVSLLTETCLSVFKMPVENVCMMDLNCVCTAIEFLSLQLEDKKLLINALPSFMKVMFECNKKKLREDRNNIATLTFLKTLMTSDELGNDVMTRVTDQTAFNQLLEWHHEEIKKIENEYHCGFYTFNHLALYYSVIQQCCEFDPECLKLAVTNESFINVILSHVVFSPIYLNDCVNLVSALLEQAWQNNLKNDLEVFYSRFHIALLNATSNNEFLVANLEWIVRLLDVSLQSYPSLVTNFVGSAEKARSPGLFCLARLVQKSSDIDPFAIYNFDATKLLWRLYELINDVIQQIIVHSPSKELLWTSQCGGEDKGANDLLNAVIAINETLLPPESTAFQLGEMLIDAINYEKSLVDKKNQVVDEAPPVNVPEPNPVSSSAETGKCSTVM